MIYPINFICIDCISTCYTPDVIRNLFQNIAKIGHIYIHYHSNPTIKLYEPIWWYKKATQTVWISIREWNDTEFAFNILNALRNGPTFINNVSGEDTIYIEHTNIQDMLRFPIDVHDELNDELNCYKYKLDTQFDFIILDRRTQILPIPQLIRQTNHSSLYSYEPIRTIFQEPLPTNLTNKNTNKNTNKTIIPKLNLSLIHPDLLDSIHSQNTNISFYIDASFNVSDEHELDDYSCHKRQRTKHSEILVYNLTI